MHGFGRVPVEDDEPPFHARWERRLWQLRGVVTGRTTIDRVRYTIEQMPPAEYLASSYYERWLWAVERLAAEQGILNSDERPAPWRGRRRRRRRGSGRFQPWRPGARANR